MIKNLPKKTKILCAIGISLFVLLICIFVISKCFNTTSSVNETEQNTINDADEKFDYKYVSFSGYKKLFNYLNPEEIEKYYLISDKEYHIVLKDSFTSIVVNDKSIFESENKILSVDLYRNILIIYTTSYSSDFKSILYLIDLDGNVIKKIDNVLYRYRNFYEDKLRYTVDNYDYNIDDGNIIYRDHYAEDHTITFLDGSISTDEINEHPNHISTPVCMDNDECILYEKDGLKISIGTKEIIYENGTKSFDSGLYVNDNKVEFASNLINVSLLPDRYLFISSCWMDGFDEVSHIIDVNGNLITNFNDKMGGFYTSRPIVSDQSNDFSDGVFTINSISKKAIEEMGNYLSGHEGYPDDYVIGKVWKFNYLGNGHVDNGYVDEIIDLGDFRNYYGSKSN